MKSKGIKNIFRSSKSVENDVLHHTRKCKRRTEPKETDPIFITGDKDRFLYALKAIFRFTTPKKLGIKKSKEKIPQKYTKVLKPLKDKMRKDGMDKSISDSSSSICTSSTSDSISSSSSSYSRTSSIDLRSESSLKERNILSIDLEHAPTTLNEGKCGDFYSGKEVWISLIVVGLLVSLTWGKLIAIGCSSICLVLLLLFHQNCHIIKKK